MLVVEGRRVRHLVIRLDRGDELPEALLRALDEAEVKAGWITGTGALEAIELALLDQPARRLHRARRIEGPSELVALAGSVAVEEGASSLRLSATVARETELGLELAAGQLVWARSYSVELSVTAFDDPALARVPDERTGLAALHATGPGATERAAAGGAMPRPPPTEPARPGPAEGGPPMPVRPVRHHDEPEAYPEPGDRVNHFHFGDCTVIDSDGDRIRLRQERDGRVREVALTMLRIEPPTLDESGKRFFRLSRKH